jgi:EH domain-containing protein 1
MTTSAFAGMSQSMLLGAGGVIGLVVLFFWMTLVLRYFGSAFHRKWLKDLDQLTPLENQTRRDTWQAVRGLVQSYLKKTVGRFSLREVKQEYAAVRRVCDKGAKEIREALNELSTITEDEPRPTDDSMK